ncbi:MAG: hypothetical protein CW338_06555 [Clostridiales bacterium]|nr:hypothetical protein [Clostridiales bacterium]
MPGRWDPWRGCHRCSEGCRYCYIHKGDAKRGIDTDVIVRSPRFDRPVEKKRDGGYKMASDLIWTCFASDFLLEDADPWREDAWNIIRERKDCTFLFLTKRIERFAECIPADWGDGWDNVVICCTVEDQKNADRRLSVFRDLPVRHKQITAQPLIERIDIERYLDGMEAVTAGGESDRDARPLDYSWVLFLREQCVRQNVAFSFRQCGTHFIRDGVEYTLPVRLLCARARAEGIDFSPFSGGGITDAPEGDL